ncbi:hypothetical protein AB0C38_40190 [Amycolatopsis sp. NPDC048633]|uniref:hypothetical protein n=1 Tax=Amycolatopsis sp. NPDC048633 TaxID=3157095 RepID=UPI0033F163E4
MTDHRDPADARLDELFGAWRAEIDEVPIPSLVDPLRAVDVVIEAKKCGRAPAPPDGAGTRPPGDAREETV